MKITPSSIDLHRESGFRRPAGTRASAPGSPEAGVHRRRRFHPSERAVHAAAGARTRASPRGMIRRRKSRADQSRNPRRSLSISAPVVADRMLAVVKECSQRQVDGDGKNAVTSQVAALARGDRG